MSLRPRNEVPPTPSAWVTRRVVAEQRRLKDERTLSLAPRPVSTGYYYTFLEAEMDEERARQARAYGYDPNNPHLKLKEVDKSTDVWDTLTPEVVDMMMNPPASYDQAYERKRNIVLLTVMAQLSRR